jgi:hypothetical protein
MQYNVLHFHALYRLREGVLVDKIVDKTGAKGTGASVCVSAVQAVCKLLAKRSAAPGLVEEGGMDLRCVCLAHLCGCPCNTKRCIAMRFIA